jgi:CxxH/CxxC protein (TIGR04129 family)
MMIVDKYINYMLGGNDMIYCCLEHVELAMDIVVDEHEVAPQLTEISEDKKLSTTCEYCGNNAVYIVAN